MLIYIHTDPPGLAFRGPGGHPQQMTVETSHVISSELRRQNEGGRKVSHPSPSRAMCRTKDKKKREKRLADHTSRDGHRRETAMMHLTRGNPSTAFSTSAPSKDVSTLSVSIPLFFSRPYGVLPCALHHFSALRRSSNWAISPDHWCVCVEKSRRRRRRPV